MNTMGKMNTSKRIGIFGGTFNPPHIGHINSMLFVQKRLQLDRIVIVPNNQNPLKPESKSPTPEQRLKMVKKIVSEHDELVVDDIEVKKGGKSYTHETVDSYSQSYLKENLYLILGIDTFTHFEHWKDFQTILEKCNILVTSRFGHHLPLSKENLPQPIQNLVADYDHHFVFLKNGTTIQFIQLDDINVSSSEIRKKLRLGRKAEEHLPLGLIDYIKTENLYPFNESKINDTKKFTEFCSQLLCDRKGINTQAYNLSEISSSFEFSLITSCTSTRHTVSMAEHVERTVFEEFGVKPLSVEGMVEGNWVLLDYGSLAIHLFYDFVRMKYKLEELWEDGVNLNIKEHTSKEHTSQKKL